MKHLKKGLAALFLITVLAMLPMMQSFAAEKTPGNVKKLTAKAASETSIKLTWSKVSKATSYIIYSVDTETGAKKRVKSTSRTQYTISGLKVNTKYTYVVYAAKKSGKTTLKSKSPSPQASATTKLLTPSKPSNFRIASYGNKSILLKWSKAKNATGYYIYQYDTETKEYKKIGSTKDTTYRVSKLKAGTKYYFKIQSYRTLQKATSTSKLTDSVSGKAVELTSTVHGRYYNATLRSDTTVTVVETGKKKTLKKGTKVTATSRSSNTVTAIMKNGTKIKIKGSKLRYNSLNYSKNAYSKSAKELFVNERGYSSNTKWLVWVSQYTLTINIFKGSTGEWKLMRSGPCVIGQDGRTPTGVFRLLFKDSAYGGVRIYFTWNPVKQWGNSFHRRVDGNTQAAVSHGCVRLGDGDLSYLNRNCPLGTTVVSY